MAEPQKSIASRAQAGPQTAQQGDVETLAAQVLSALAHRSGSGSASLDPVLLAEFCADVLGGDRSIGTRALATLRRRGIPPTAIIDGYIPAAARELGERWVRDDLSFADVTIGAARLQAMLRELGAANAADMLAASDAPNVMMIVPHDEYHTLGGMTAANQMRRMGASVCLALGQTEEEILQKAMPRQFDLVAISVSCRQKLDSARRLVAALRRVLGDGVPVVIGGRVADGAEDICALTGADAVTTDAHEALRLCRIGALQAPGAARTGKDQ
ncbi:cobalamin B12-binding domain-containing protein [Rhodovulum sulfidophilum]|uniref:cobalamin B12-binding domain-containing protein n=1 Tax=Rhodovulum sulfidophilum TaxID=35806 RepID=UPI0019213297|nr:cobalamin-dependent protein [Rhodovulum sulfidophilum]MBL3573816.1 cobalamin-dependent protein [Rhodovulum sulfidophilum]MCE8431940.1 cobalamin B12-binding domain-containing protein [Rhodovulum sulfidophilum]MCF4115334.1 cobalamin B12-binding domain-containing protein [Rhodovulum sulfidophilum]